MNDNLPPDGVTTPPAPLPESGMQQSVHEENISGSEHADAGGLTSVGPGAAKDLERSAENRQAHSGKQAQAAGDKQRADRGGGPRVRQSKAISLPMWFPGNSMRMKPMQISCP